MKNFNIRARTVMYCICISLEYDLIDFIDTCSSNLKFTQDELNKVQERNKKIDLSDTRSILQFLDLRDYLNIITRDPHQLALNNDKIKTINEYFMKVIPVRNRVMHPKPTEIGDRSLLNEVMETISHKIHWIEWTHVNKTKYLLENDPVQLISYEHKRVYTEKPDVYNNLPDPEFDDTGFIGRKSDINNIKQLILNQKNQIISIIGNGGIGKTALAIKLLYDLMEINPDRFDAILWISLKTKTLDNGEFAQLNNTILEFNDIISEGIRLSVKENDISPEKNLLKFMEEFKVLLVLDNLETINHAQINSFLKEIPFTSKVLITSRYGLGELEIRCNLKGLNKNDSVQYFRELSKYFGLEQHKKDQKEIEKIIENDLYSNPLSIKWYMSGIYNGISPSDLLSKKDDLIAFCMSNVYSHLDHNSKLVLQLFLVENKMLYYCEIDYYVRLDKVQLNNAINNLLRTNFIEDRDGNFILTNMAKDYLSKYHAPSRKFINKILERSKHLNHILQDLRVQKENEFFSPTSLFISRDRNIMLAASYLYEALEESYHGDWQGSNYFINKAKDIAPNYFEIYKVMAFIYSQQNEVYRAKENYNISITKTKTDFQKARVLFLFAKFFQAKLEDYEEALTMFVEAERICMNLDLPLADYFAISSEKARTLMLLGKLDDAESILNGIKHEYDNLIDRNKNIYITISAEIDRRRADLLDIRDSDKKVVHLTNAISKIETLRNIDKKTYATLSKILKDCSYIYHDNDAMALLESSLQKHSFELRNISGNYNNVILSNINDHSNLIPKEILDNIRYYLHDYKKDSMEINEKDQGLIVSLYEDYGFIANANHDGIYFSRKNESDKIKVGSLVKFNIYENKVGICAKNLKLL